MKLHDNLLEQLRGFELAEIPVWVISMQQLRILWGNTRALELWRASTLEELCERDFSDMSQTALTRLFAHHDAIKAGRTAQEQWTIYPQGKPTAVKIHFRALPLASGELAMLAQALIQHSDVDPAVLRGVEALRYCSMMVSLLEPTGAVLMHNPAALRALGQETLLSSWFFDGELADRILHAAAEGTELSTETQVRTTAGERWHAIEVRKTLDPTTGKPAVLLQQLDISERKHAEQRSFASDRMVKELQQTLALIEDQRQQILALSAPVLDMGHSTLAVPIIGQLTVDRGHEIATRLLEATMDRRATTVLIDLTGASGLDETSASQLVRILRGLRLLGARPILTGIQPTLAQHLIRSGADMSEVTALRTLREGIEYAQGGRPKW